MNHMIYIKFSLVHYVKEKSKIRRFASQSEKS